MRVTSNLVRRWALWALACLSPVHGHPAHDANASLDTQSNLTQPVNGTSAVAKPLYAIAHRLLGRWKVREAVSMGANALHVDLTPWRNTGWWADYDGLPTSAGDKAELLFDEIAAQRRRGANIVFVWLDIHHPDFCTEQYPRCHFVVLRNLARRILQGQGIHVIYGFPPSSINGSAYQLLQGDLGQLEGINVNGETAEVKSLFQAYGPVDVSRRSMSYGSYDLAARFGNCHESRWYVCTELMNAVTGKNEIGRAYGWVVDGREPAYLNKLLDIGVDGVVFGFRANAFRKHKIPRAAFADIKKWVDRHPHLRYLATNADKPWG